MKKIQSMNIKNTILLVALCFSLPILQQIAFAQRGNLEPIQGRKITGIQYQELYANSYALVVGISAYSDKDWQYLPNAARDAEEIEAVLKMHGFQTKRLTDPDKRTLETELDRFFHNPQLTDKDRLLLYFAGHGHSIQNIGFYLGYIVPKDAVSPRKVEDFKVSALSLDKFKTFAESTPANHVLFVFDSCFSGLLNITRSGGVAEPPPAVIEHVGAPLRQFITAGGANEVVPDVSIFKKYFIDGIQGQADRNGDGFVSGTDLASYLFENVTKASLRKQRPQEKKNGDSGPRERRFYFRGTLTGDHLEYASRKN